MFRQRSSRKPSDDLLASFRQQFPEVAAARSTISSSAPPAAVPQLAGTTAAAVENPVISAPTPEGSREAFRDQDPTPRAINEQWRFTPSLLDPNSYSFLNFANAPPGYYIPTPSGTNSIYHPQAGDLHTPTLRLGMCLGTPLCMPTSDGAMSGPTMMDVSSSRSLQPHQFRHFNPFVQAPPAQASFAPFTFVHRDTGYETMDQDGSPVDSDLPEDKIAFIETALQNTLPMMGFQSLPASAEMFRFHTTLNAPTAMIKHADEIPITYLNKTQTYLLSIIDTNTTGPIAPGSKYRTYVRISFEDDEQRQNPEVCWSLWKEGRGTNEAHQRGGKLQAVEFVELGESAEGDDKDTKVELENSFFDGFSVIWTPGINGAPEVTVGIRFNFLSTDFSHSKGIKGIPVRLYAKASPYPTDTNQPAANANPEICFCKVKLFRDHGAERKLSNDVAHVKKTINKLEQQISQVKSAIKDFRGRKRGTAQQPARPGKVQKHKRTWSISSASSASGTRPPAEDDLYVKLQALQDVLASSRPVSVLYLRGEERDDPDLYPVSLPGESDLFKTENHDGPAWQARSSCSSITGSSMVSPPPTSQVPVAGPSGQWRVEGSDSRRRISDKPLKVNKTDHAGNLIGWIEALGVDSSYRPPPEKVTKPIACFYILRQNPTPGQREYYKAVYLTQRTLQHFNARVAMKWDLDASKILRTVHVLQHGLEVEMDDVISELKGGQDMMLDVVEVGGQPAPTKREWEMAIDSNDGASTQATGIELRLTF